MKIPHQIKAIFTGLLFSCSVIPVVMADDIEIYTTSGAQTSGVNPNLLFIIDGSSDMLTTSLVTESYDPATTYDGSCGSAYIYYAKNGDPVPDCAGTGNNEPDYFNSSAFVCEAAKLTTQLVYEDNVAVVDENGDAVVDENGEPIYEDNVAVLDENGDQTTEVVAGPLVTLGIFSGRLAHYGTAGSGGNASPAWVTIDITRDEERSYTVECEADSGVHGETDVGNTYIDNSSKYVSTADTTNGDAHPIWTDGDSLLTLYSANYINYTNTEDLTVTFEAFFDQIRDAIEYVVDSNSAVNIGMMVLDQKDGGVGDPGSEGGGILYEMQDGSAARGNFIPQMWALAAEGSTPLSEAYYEALLYFGGKAVDYGSAASPPLVGSATDANNANYTTPIEMSCQKNYIIVASNGKATDDDISATRQAALNGFTTGQCSDTITAGDTSDDNIHDSTDDGATSAGLTNDNCLDELAYWAANNDVAEREGVDQHEGEQTIITHTVGFGYSDIADFDQQAGKQLLIDTAEKGGGTFYTASSKDEIRDAFDDIIFNALKVNSTFSSPAVSVNAFNRSTHLNDLYFTLFKPGDGQHWEGNLKKYKLKFFTDSDDVDGDLDVTESLPFIADKDGNHAIDDEDGFFDADAWSYWSATADGKEVGEGGAASGFTISRKVYTFTGTYNGVTPSSAGALTAVDPDADVLTDAMLDIETETSESVEIVSGTSYRNSLINWASGRDALSEYGVVDTYNDMRLQMGDPLHAEPALVQYGEATYQGATVADLVAYVATNDGYLHAINVNGDSGNEVSAGSEYFSFIPQELLPNLKIAMENTGGEKLYGLDGSVVAWINDADGNGTIEGDNEHVYIYVSMRRGGNNIYALDVTTRTAPKLLWVIKGGEGDYTQLGQTWSTVNVEKIKDNGVEKTVLIFGGGYDTDQDLVELTTADSEGHTVYIADAASGARLWTADAHDDSTSTVAMNYSVPARVKPLDISGDGFIDRLYVADMGGQIFRFDIDNSSESALASSIIGGVIADLGDASASLGNGGSGTGDERVAANTRRFYYPPDVALINAEDGPYHSLVISSGYRAHPLDDDIQDRIYMIKDRNTGPITSADTYVTLTEANLHNATDNNAGGEGGTDSARATELGNITAAEGWYIYLNDENDSTKWLGEKGLAEALIIEGVAIVTTYTPDLIYDETSCEPNLGLGKVYFLDILDATAAFPESLDSRGDRHIELTRGGIPPTPNVIITEDGVPTLCVGTECSKAELGLGVRKTYWYEVN